MPSAIKSIFDPAHARHCRIPQLEFSAQALSRPLVPRHGHRDPSIAGLVLDSPFSSLEMVVRELIDAAAAWDGFQGLSKIEALGLQRAKGRKIQEVALPDPGNLTDRFLFHFCTARARIFKTCVLLATNLNQPQLKHTKQSHVNSFP